MTRYVHFSSRLTGWNQIKSRASQFGVELTDAQAKECTAKLKQLADIRPLTTDDGETIIRNFHRNLRHGLDHPLLPDLSLNEQQDLQIDEKKLREEPEKRSLEHEAMVDAQVDHAMKKQKLAA